MIKRGLRNRLCMASTSDGRKQAFLNRRLAGVILPARKTRELLPGDRHRGRGSVGPAGGQGFLPACSDRGER
jgi:hypothetical protein